MQTIKHKMKIKMYSIRIPSHKSFCTKQIEYLIFCYSMVAHVPHVLEKFCWFPISNIPLFRPFQLVLVILTPRRVFRRGFENFPPHFVRFLHSLCLKLTVHTCKKKAFQKGNTCSNHPFSAKMMLETHPKKKCIHS